MINSFTFCVLSYNHESYIIEHLESIKFQIIKYGYGVECNIIINDDGSSDNTVFLMDAWLSKNRNYFTKVVKLFNEKNIGTCKSLQNIANLIETKYCKITAGDDVYMPYNIFEFISNNLDYSLISGLPIRLLDGKVKISFFEIFNYIASDFIYKNNSLLFRISNLSIINAPNLFYSTYYLKNKSIMDFLNDFDVVEDWPLQISIANNDDKARLVSAKIPIVFYRRTSGSTYLIASQRFARDQCLAFNYLINLYIDRGQKIQAYLLEIRKFIFLGKWGFFGKFLNIPRYIYFLHVLYYSPLILFQFINIKISLEYLQKYYDDVKLRANFYY